MERRHEPPSTSKLISAYIVIGNLGPHPATSWICLCCVLLPMAACKTRDLTSSNPYRTALSIASASTTTQSHFPSRDRLPNPKSQIPTTNPPPSSPLCFASLLTSSATKISSYGLVPAIVTTALNGCEQDMKRFNITRDGTTQIIDFPHHLVSPTCRM